MKRKREREIVRFADNANYRFGDAPREREKREDGGGVKIRLHVNASFFKVSWIFLGYACSILLGSLLRKKGWLNVGETRRLVSWILLIFVSSVYVRD